MEEEDKLKSYRQPMVSATGILLGFTYSAGAAWVTRAFATHRIAETIVGLSLCIQIPIYVIVMYRALNNNYPRERANEYYRTTLYLFIVGSLISFLALVVIMFESFVIERR